MTATVDAARTYRPYGAAKALFACKDREVLIDGPVRTGKSLAILSKVYRLCEKYPGIRVLFVRATRESLTQSALKTWEEEVIPPSHRDVLTQVARNNRQSYRFPNGTEVVTGGMDNVGKFMSTDYDLIYVMEATQIADEQYTQLTTRNVRFHMPYNQMLLDANPDAPTHWLRQRFLAGTVTRFQAQFSDNPKYWDMESEDWTPAGRELIATLDRLPPMQRARLRDGLWVAAEGAVYDCFDADADVIEPFAIPDWWPRHVGLDFGGQHTAALFYAVNPITYERVLYREYLEGGRTAAQHTFFLRVGEPKGLHVVGGSASEGQWRQEFTAAGMVVQVPAISDVALGISRVYGQHTRHNIKVFNTCRGYLEQKTDYRYKRDATVPGEIERKHTYHFMDAERYVISAMGDGLGTGVGVLERLKKQGVYA